MASAPVNFTSRFVSSSSVSRRVGVALSPTHGSSDSPDFKAVCQKAAVQQELSQINRFSQVLLVVSILLSVLYWSTVILPLNGYLHAVVKWLSITALTAIVIRYLTTRQEWFLVLALFFHSVGDIILAHPYEDYLMYSMGPFLLGHICYILTFKSDIPAVAAIRRSLSRAKVALIAAGVLYPMVMATILIPPLYDTPLIIPVIVYMVIVSIMVISSVVAGYRLPWMTLGCWLYILSDSLIAIDKFYVPLPSQLHMLSWPLYYAGQILIAGGLLKEKRRVTCMLFAHELLSI